MVSQRWCLVLGSSVIFDYICFNLIIADQVQHNARNFIEISKVEIDVRLNVIVKVIQHPQDNQNWSIPAFEDAC